MGSEQTNTETFQVYTAPDASDIHVILKDWQGETVDFEMNLDPATAASFREQLQGLELDVTKLEQDGVLEGAHHGAPYYDLQSFGDAVQDNYNQAMTTAVIAHNEIASELATGQITGPEAKESAFDLNGRSWQQVVPMLESAISSGASHLEFMRDSYPEDDMSALQQSVDTLRQATQDLQNSGALAEQVAGVTYSHVKPPGPGVESQSDMSFSEYQATPSDVDLESGTPLKP